LSTVLKKRKVEAHGDFILGPVSPKEYKDTVAELNGSRTNRVFEFFKINPPERVGFAKHREAVEKKAAALAAAEADAEETATSSRAAPKKTGRRGAPAAAIATAEGKARKKRDGRPVDSPPSPKRTRIVDVETGLVGDVIATVPLRSAAPSAGAGRETTGPLLIPLSPRRKIVMTTAMFASCPLLVTLPASRAPLPSAPKYRATRMTPAPPPPTRLTRPLKALSNPPPLRPRLPKKMISSPKRRKEKMRSPKAAATG
jgi:hypothetical protein